MFDSEEHEMHGMFDIDGYEEPGAYVSPHLPERATAMARRVALSALRNTCHALFTHAMAHCDRDQRTVIDHVDMVFAAKNLARAFPPTGPDANCHPEWADALTYHPTFPPAHYSSSFHEFIDPPRRWPGHPPPYYEWFLPHEVDQAPPATCTPPAQ